MPHLKSLIIALKVLCNKSCALSQNLSTFLMLHFVFNTILCETVQGGNDTVQTDHSLTFSICHKVFMVNLTICPWHSNASMTFFTDFFLFFFVCHKLNLRLKSILCSKWHAWFVVKFTSALKFDAIHWSVPPPDGSGNQRWPMSCCSRDLAVFCLAACKLLTCPLLNDRARMHETLLCIVFPSHA